MHRGKIEYMVGMSNCSNAHWAIQQYPAPAILTAIVMRIYVLNRFHLLRRAEE